MAAGNKPATEQRKIKKMSRKELDLAIGRNTKVGKKGGGADVTSLLEKINKAKKNLWNKKAFPRRKKSPMEKEKVLSTLKSEAQAVGGNVISANEMQAATKGLKTLTDKGPGRLKLAFKGGGRAFGKNS